MIETNDRKVKIWTCACRAQLLQSSRKEWKRREGLWDSWTSIRNTPFTVLVICSTTYPSTTINHHKNLQGCLAMCALCCQYSMLMCANRKEETPLFFLQTTKSGCHMWYIWPCENHTEIWIKSWNQIAAPGGKLLIRP